jgi:predicted secreted Zn-dependent protease
MRSRRIAAALTVVLVASACAGTLPPSASGPAPTGSAASPRTSATSATSTPTPSQSASASPAPVLGLKGIWRVRKVLSPTDRSALIPGNAFEDEAFVVTPGCADEPCPTVDVRITPLGRSTPVEEASLKLKGDRYVSAAKAENEGPCLDADGDRVHGGATVTSTLELWAANVRAAGTAVERVDLLGSMTLHLEPTAIGTAAGCKPQAASYDITGKRVSYAVRVDEEPIPEPDIPANTAGGLADLPSIGVKVSGARIDYFSIEGDTLIELDRSLARGGLKACGPINYTWHDGDDRPAACAITAFNDLSEAIERSVDPETAACTITEAKVQAISTIKFPRWTAPDRVPKRLLAWWRDVVVFIRDHEAGHVRISRDQVKRLNARLLGASCLQTVSIIRTWSKEINAAHEGFDRVEYQIPWPVPPPGY